MGQEKTEAVKSHDFLNTFVRTLAEFLPVLLDRFLQVKNSPAFEKLEGEIERLKRRTDILRFRFSWLFTLFFLLLIWNIFLTLYIFLTPGR